MVDACEKRTTTTGSLEINIYFRRPTDVSLIVAISSGYSHGLEFVLVGTLPCGHEHPKHEMLVMHDGWWT
jgi:hypothetical protein